MKNPAKSTLKMKKKLQLCVPAQKEKIAVKAFVKHIYFTNSSELPFAP